MKKIVLRKTGGPEVLNVEEFPDLAGTLGPREVRIDVHFSGINFADIMMRLGLYRDAPPRPYTPGYEVSGVVQAVGSDVTAVKPGDEVAAGSLFGGYASQIVVPDSMVFPKPPHLSLAEAAALPVNWATAYAAIVEMGRVREGDRVLVDAATGGVGTIALQILRAIGARTIGLTGSPSKREHIEKLGAKAVLHSEFRADSSLKGFDFVLNSEGGASVRAQYDRLAVTGRIVNFGASSIVTNGKRDWGKILKLFTSTPKFSPLKMMDENHGVYGLNVLRLFENRDYLAGLVGKWKSVEEMKLKPHVARVFPAREAGAAHHLLETRGATGKVLLSWKD